MNLLNYDKDIIKFIFSNIYDTCVSFKFRLINKTFNEIFMNYFKSIKTNIIPRSAFINIRECNICKCNICLKINSLYNKKLIYKYDSLPHKCIIHCLNKKCYLSAIKKYLIDIKYNNVYPFCEITDKFIEENYFVKKYYIDNVRKWENKWYIECEDIYSSRFYRINNLHNLINHNLFEWFLDRSKELC